MHGTSSAIASSSHQPPSAPSGQWAGVLKMRSVMPYAAETWAMKVHYHNPLRHNDRAMIRWICNVKARDEVSSDSFLTKLGI